MDTQNKHSLLTPVGVVAAIPTSTAIRGGQTMIGVAHIDLSLAPVGTELFVQPSESKLRLEIEVANENALHWQNCYNRTNTRVAQQRTEKYKALGEVRELKQFVQELLDSGTISCGDRRAMARELLNKE